MKAVVLVVGAGYAGSVVAERLASAGRRVIVVEKRSHIGGNAYDEYDEQGVLIHRYGPHIFHTNSRRVVEYLSNFTEWRPYEHHALACVDGKLLPIPINLDTVNGFYGLGLREEEVGAFMESVREPRSPVLTSEDVVPNAVGRDLYEKFFKYYTRKHWGLDPSQLSAGVAARVPVRTDRDDRYWTDDFQALPREGYTRMFETMLDNPNVSIELGVDFREIRNLIQASHVVYTGPVDAYFDHRFGRLPYRSLHFEHTHQPGSASLPAGSDHQLSERARLHPRHRVQAPYRPDAPRLIHRARVPAKRRRSLLPDPAPGKPGPIQALPVPRRAREGRNLRGPPRPVPLLQHGSGGRSRAKGRERDTAGRQRLSRTMSHYGPIPSALSHVRRASLSGA